MRMSELKMAMQFVVNSIKGKNIIQAFDGLDSAIRQNALRWSGESRPVLGSS